jgi:nitrite reductase/ring-hydroxylating ferredoxin subunit
MPEFKIARTTDIAPGQGRTIRVQGHQIALFNLDGDFVAIDDACPHMRADLSGGELEGRIVTCSWHGWRFDLDTGKCLNVEWAKVRRYPLRLEGNAIHLILEPEPEPDEEEEDLPEIVWKDPDC